MLYQRHQTNLTLRAKGCWRVACSHMKAKGGHLLDRSIAPYPPPVATLLAPPDRLTSDLRCRQIQTNTHTRTQTTNLLISKAKCFSSPQAPPFSKAEGLVWDGGRLRSGNVDLSAISGIQMKVNQGESQTSSLAFPRCLEAVLMKVWEAAAQTDMR